jgi:N-acetyl-gamma-glutamyl-phosphate reductase
LMRLLSGHPGVSIDVLTADRSAGSDFRTIYPQFAYLKNLPILTKWEDSASVIEKCDIAFCCLPHGTTQEIISTLAKSSKSVKVRSNSSELYFHSLSDLRCNRITC